MEVTFHSQGRRLSGSRPPFSMKMGMGNTRKSTTRSDVGRLWSYFLGYHKSFLNRQFYAEYSGNRFSSAKAGKYCEKSFHMERFGIASYGFPYYACQPIWLAREHGRDLTVLSHMVIGISDWFQKLIHLNLGTMVDNYSTLLTVLQDHPATHTLVWKVEFFLARRDTRLLKDTVSNQVCNIKNWNWLVGRVTAIFNASLLHLWLRSVM